ncbi:hypothetical protein FUAX_15900 [Fulvitalea axinellae]|uniref:PH domain-containing protein n=1 Tax=Fulvitalea axinellae TaxID=1182444 RepID=A0AAU9CZM4_9BACT|nr:hypothetical protein FUAX_15900 [Fulvitalea axinellae]
MIVSKPKFKALSAIVMFLILAYGALFFNLRSFMLEGSMAWWRWLLTVVLCMIVVGVTIKSLMDFKTMRLGANELKVKRYFGLIKDTWDLTTLVAWTEERIKTKNGEFRELTLVFPKNKVVKLTIQQDSGYERIYKYLVKKQGKKKVDPAK